MKPKIFAIWLINQKFVCPIYTTDSQILDYIIT